jgi:short-subunit dehydrogenase
MFGNRDLGLREGRGNIINVASMYGLVGGPAHIPCSLYVAAKHDKHSSPLYQQLESCD